MRLDNLFCMRFVIAWTRSRSVRQAVRRLGNCVTEGEARRIARRLRREGVMLPRRPEGPGLLGHVYLFHHPVGDYQDLRGRDAYRVGTGTLIEGPWECRRCGDSTVRGFCILSGRRHRFVCRECVRVVD